MSDKPEELPPIPPPSIESADLSRLHITANLAALLALADESADTAAVHREAAFLVRAPADVRRKAADDLDTSARLERGEGARWKRAAAAFVRGLDAPRPS